MTTFIKLNIKRRFFISIVVWIVFFFSTTNSTQSQLQLQQRKKSSRLFQKIRFNFIPHNSSSSSSRKERRNVPKEYSSSFSSFTSSSNTTRKTSRHNPNPERCGTKELSLEQKNQIRNIVKEYKTQQNTQQRSSSSPTSIQFDVYFHVLHNGEKGNLTNAQIIESINVLNRGFAGQEFSSCQGNQNFDDDYSFNNCLLCEGFKIQNLLSFGSFGSFLGSSPNNKIEYGSTVPGSGVDTNISFYLKGITRSNIANWFEEMEDSVKEFKPYLHQGDCTTLNIYSGDLSFLGSAQYPIHCNENLMYDGVMIKHSSIPGVTEESIPNDYFEGDSLTHEVGHWLGLYHTFEGVTCQEGDDHILDTATQEYDLGVMAQCKHGTNSCPFSEGNDPIHNFMNYSPDCCMDSFTQGQKDHMMAMIQKYRSSSSNSESKT